MTRFLSLFAVLLLFSASEASACWPWCSLFNHADPDPDEELSEVELIVHPALPSEARSIGPALTGPTARWGAKGVERLFEYAYGSQILDFDSKRELLDKWLSSMGTTQTGRDGARQYEYGVRKGLKAFTVNSIYRPEAKTLRVVINDNADPLTGLEAASARKSGLTGADSLAGLWARAFHAHGQGGIDRIETWFDTLNQRELDRYNQAIARNFSPLQAAEETDSGRFIREFYGFGAAEVTSTDAHLISAIFQPHREAYSELTVLNVSKNAPYVPIDWATIQEAPVRVDFRAEGYFDQKEESENKAMDDEKR